MTDQELLKAMQSVVQTEIKDLKAEFSEKFDDLQTEVSGLRAEIDGFKVLMEANDSKLDTIAESQTDIVKSHKSTEKQLLKLETVEERLSVFEGVVRLHSEDISELKQEIQNLKKAE